MGVTQNSYIPHVWEVSDLNVSGTTRPRPLNQTLGILGCAPFSTIVASEVRRCVVSRAMV